MSAPSSPSLSKYNYTTLTSTLEAVRAEVKANFALHQAQEEATKALETYREPRTEALFQALTQRFLDKPEKKLTERGFAQIRAGTRITAVMQTVTGKNPVTPLDIPRCWSSMRMTELMNWRNPDDQAKPGILRSIINITKRVVAEIALPFLAVSAAIEAIATKVLVLGAKALKPISKSPIEYVSKHGLNGLSRSAQFTSVWTASALWHNIIQTTLAADERDARKELFNGYFKI